MGRLYSCDLQLFCVGFNSMPNLIVIIFNLLYPVFLWDFIVKVVCERECEDSRLIEDQRCFCG